VNEVLDLSKVEARRVELRRETISLDALTGEVTSSIAAEAKRRGLEFVADVPGAVTVFVDPLRCRQILLNLLSNAVKFTPAPGSVNVSARVEDDALVIEVRDTGIGIPPDKVGRVFGSFERLHEGRYEAQGTGLGLALSKQLVELHGGTIDFVTAEGKGTSFAVRLPGVVVAEGDDRILVVEDESRDADLIVALAKREGLSADVAAGVDSARRSLRRRLPLAIVVDLRLPDGRGEDVLREVDALAGGRHVPTIVVTVEDDDGGSRLRGADDHLTKPLDHERLAGWLRQVASRAKDRHANSSR
jgi:CheY-like chemotaxis protein